jgi:hypothetical protein
MRRGSLALPDGDRRRDTTHAEPGHNSAHDHLRAAVRRALYHGAYDEPGGTTDGQRAPAERFAPEHRCQCAHETAEFVHGDDEAEEGGVGVTHRVEKDGVGCKAGEDSIVVSWIAQLVFIVRMGAG